MQFNQKQKYLCIYNLNFAVIYFTVLPWLVSDKKKSTKILGRQNYVGELNKCWMKVANKNLTKWRHKLEDWP